MRIRVLILGVFVAAATYMIAPSLVAQTVRDTLVFSGETFGGTNWRLVEIRSMDDAVGGVRPDDPSHYTMNLNSDSTVTMRLGCNRANGTWSFEPGADGTSGSFEFGPLAVTRALCPPPRLDERIVSEARFVRTYLLRDGWLYLSLMADGGIHTWKRETAHVPDPPETGGPRNWEVVRDAVLHEQLSEDAGVLAKLAPATLLDNLGCEAVEGRVWCDVQQLGGGPRGYVLYENLKPAISPDGSVATGPDDSAIRAGEGRFDASGTIPCAQSSGQPMSWCEFGVARAGGGYATLVVSRPDGRTRTIFFRMGIAIGADTSQADGYPEFRSTRKGDLTVIRVGSERYEIPDAVLLGG